MSAARPNTGFGPGPIPHQEILAYCELFGIRDPVRREELVGIVRMLDAAYLTDVAARQARQGSAT